MKEAAKLDLQYIWHPFTQMQDWLAREPIVIRSGRGTVLKDVNGKKYLDANSSIWTNLHGHNHPVLNAALRRQLKKVAHVSALGLANEPASFLAERLVSAANVPGAAPALEKVFYSDDGSTALEVAIKLSYEATRRSGRSAKPLFLSLEGAYHGDTVGAVSVGHIGLFHRAYKGLLFQTKKVPAPNCYRCPYNRAAPERADARSYRKCDWECARDLEKTFERQQKMGRPITGFVVEPLIQGAAGMVAQPNGWLRRASELARHYQAHLIADEVLTGFGRAGGTSQSRTPSQTRLFACQQEGVQPDFLALAKGLTGGYLPMAATLTTQAVFDLFLGEYSEFKTFFHGHSYTANPLGAATALASMKILQSRVSIRQRHRLAADLADHSSLLWRLPHVGDIRQVGLIVGIELVQDWRTRAPFPLEAQAGIRVCAAMARRGVLTRPIGNVVVVMPPYCATTKQVQTIFEVLARSIEEALGKGP